METGVQKLQIYEFLLTTPQASRLIVSELSNSFTASEPWNEENNTLPCFLALYLNFARLRIIKGLRQYLGSRKVHQLAIVHGRSCHCYLAQFKR